MDETMNEKVETRMSAEMFDFVEKYRIENNLGDKPDVVREIINKEIKKQNSIFYKLKKLF